jgi:riboflavin transporter FmnP
MAEGKYFHAEQLIILAATETLTYEKMAVTSVILTGSAAGTFVIQIGTAVLTYYTVSPLFTLQLYFNRSTNFLELTSGPAGASMTVLLEQKQ